MVNANANESDKLIVEDLNLFGFFFCYSTSWPAVLVLVLVSEQNFPSLVSFSFSTS